MFTDKALAALKPDPARRYDVFDTEVSGLAVRVNSGGSKTWSLFYRNTGGQQRRLALGQYPQVGLADARRRARRHLNRVSDGADPAAEKRAVRVAETFGELATAYLDQYAKVRKRSWSEDDRMLRADLLPAWRHRKVREITRRDVRALIEGIVARGAPTAANRTWALVSTMFNFAIRRDWLEANPASLIDRQPETSRDRVLSADELRALWTALKDLTTLRRAEPDTKGPVVPPMIARGLQVLLLTAQRPGEVFRMRWADLDLPDDWLTSGPVDAAHAWWTIPAEHSKNKEPHRVPLGAGVVAILRAAHAVAPDNNPWVFAGQAGASVADRAKKAAAELRHAHAIGFAFHRHDLRRTAATGMAAAGIGRDTIAHVLNHVDRGSRATAVYDRYGHDAEKRVALETWERRLEAVLLEKPEDAKVVPIGRGTRSGGAA